MSITLLDVSLIEETKKQEGLAKEEALSKTVFCSPVF